MSSRPYVELHARSGFSFLEGASYPQELALEAQRLGIAALGVADRTHDAVFDAVWNAGELGIVDPATQRIKSKLPTIEDAARFYNRTAGVPIATFLSTAKSFAIDSKVRGAEEAIVAYRVDRTPTLIVNGKYRLHAESAGGNDQVIELVKWLVAKESAGH